MINYTYSVAEMLDDSPNDYMLSVVDQASESLGTFEGGDNPKSDVKTKDSKKRIISKGNPKKRIEIVVHETKTKTYFFEEEILIQIKTVIIVFSSPLMFLPLSI